MSSTLYDTQGNRFLIESVLGPEQASYAFLFTNAVTYRARHVSANFDDTFQHPPPSTAANVGICLPTAPKSNVISDTVVVTYIPLVSSLQSSTPSNEAAALRALQENIRLRRQVEHPFLRSLLDVFYTRQCLVAPVSRNIAPNTDAEAVAPVCRPFERDSPATSSAQRRERYRSASFEKNGGAEEARDGDRAEREDALASASASSPFQIIAGTALVIVEDFVEGCTLADYAEAVACKRLTPSNAKLRRDAAGIAYQLAHLLHYLHDTGHVLCRELPLDNIALDVNKGFISVRLPLSAVRLLPEAGARCLTDTVAELALGASQLHHDDRFAWTEELRPLHAPELRRTASWDAFWHPLTTPEADSTPVAFGAADIWMLGVVTALLCTLNHKNFVHNTRAGRLAILCSQIESLPVLLPFDMEEGMQQLIHSCLEISPTKRPTATAVLKSAAFVPNRSHTELEQHRAVISIAEAVTNAAKCKTSPASLQTVDGRAVSRAAAWRAVTTAAPDTELTILSLQDAAWDVSPVYRDVFLPNQWMEQHEEPMVPQSSQPLGQEVPSLAQATQYALHDMERLYAKYERLFRTDLANAPFAVPNDTVHDEFRQQLRRSRQMPPNMPGVARIFEELTERFTQLERSNPDASFRFLELLVEGLSSSTQDVAVVRESVTLADALLQVSRLPPPPTSNDAAERMQSVEEAGISNSGEVTARDCQVADVLRAMPSMPERMLASDRAANTSAVLYNHWLKRERKKFVKSDGY
ncbi:hypothetical protein ABL78_0604 [Leptomonas seymouri]|uniref:Protein kinase domain-containing protein n=1 Tax=Leptomonas seymouri TaxID=5684 RepID=A0A0N1PFG5_LEPSE|nr:hypothetical protein ABL78_0604 [Leptomonas seymouri]|eukprot:KPI90222.1 hypothetical protein ABL78_0604 [Leptomonas seymouri]